MSRDGRPRKPVGDPRVGRRRAQYRNAKRRAKGLPPEAVPGVSTYERRECDLVSVWLGSHWVPALIDGRGRRIFLGEDR